MVLKSEISIREGKHMRKSYHFNNHWLFKKTDQIPSSLPVEGWEEVNLPHTWNAFDGQDGGNDYWRGTATYLKSFERPEVEEDGRVILELEGAAMTADIFVNGENLDHHEGGYSTVRADITDALRDGDNLIAIKVDNSENDRVYPQKADFTFYGGLYRNVNLITVSKEHFALIEDGTPGLKVTPKVHEDGSAEVRVEAFCRGGKSVLGQIDSLSLEKEVVDGKAELVFQIDKPHLWQGKEDPYLYKLELDLRSEHGDICDQITTRFGIRTFSIDPDKGFFLNRKSYPLRGVSMHQDLLGKGNALSLEDMKESMAVVNEIGANTLRLAHYQHSQEFLDLCDENGIIVWAEIPMITMYMEEGRENTLTQMRELVKQCYNHPCIVCWGLSNEITAAGIVNEGLTDNLRALNDLCHELDQTRPTTMADVFMLETDSPLHEIPDIESYNLYFGWYLGELCQNDEFFDEFHKKYPDKVIGFSEYGADANRAFHSSAPDRGDYSEEYQCIYHEHMVKMIEERPFLWATHVWNLFDFAADGRDEGGKKGQNQKGLVEFDHKTKKDAFYLYKAWWNQKDPFVHLCGKRYENRSESTTMIKVYSNLPKVTLFVDGREIGSVRGDKVFTWKIPISGLHHIEARAETGKGGYVTDSSRIRKVDQPDTSYFLTGAAPVTNWFDEPYKEDFCSIEDSIGDLMRNPKAAALLTEISKKAQASRGDVAKSTSGNKNLQKMMAHMTLKRMLLSAGPSVITEAQIKALNRALQEIRKN